MHHWSRTRRVTTAAAIGVALGCLLAVVGLASRPENSPWLAFGVFAPAMAIPTALLTYWLFRPSAKALAEAARNEHSIEETWGRDTAAGAFWTLAVLLFLSDSVGRWLAVPWLAPLTHWHIWAAAIVAFASNYALVRWRAR